MASLKPGQCEGPKSQPGTHEVLARSSGDEDAKIDANDPKGTKRRLNSLQRASQIDVAFGLTQQIRHLGILNSERSKLAGDIPQII